MADWTTGKYLTLQDSSKNMHGNNRIQICNPRISEDRLCGLVVTVLGYRFGGLGSIPGTTRFSGGGEKKKENK
jgi:hypothetical protein